MTSPGVSGEPEICPRCHSAVPTDSAECPGCGYAANGTAPTKDASQSVLALLSAANLARMRGRWEEAIQKCVEALRYDPQNSTAHSLVGDIYQDQGRREEAIQWYQMALELDPHNAADRTKLDRLLNPEVTTSVDVRPPLWQRVGIPAALTLAFLMMCVGIWALVSTRQQGYSPLTNPGDPPPIQLPPSLSPGAKRQGTSRNNLAPRPAPTAAPVAGVETNRETKLHQGLASNLAARQNAISVLNVQTDPSVERAAITLMYRPRETLDSSQVVQLAAETTAQVFRLDTYLQSCKIRVLTPRMGGAAPEIALIAGSTRSQAASAMAPEGVFSSVWWNPAVVNQPPANQLPAPSGPPSPPPVRMTPELKLPTPPAEPAPTVPPSNPPAESPANAPASP